jgi:hypothetical protein
MRNFSLKLPCLPNLPLSEKEKGTANTVRKGIPHNHVDLPPPLISVEATRVCKYVGNDEVLLAAVYKSPDRPCSDSDIIELLDFQRKAILAGGLNAKHQFLEQFGFRPLR